MSPEYYYLRIASEQQHPINMDKVFKCLGDPINAPPNQTAENQCQRDMYNTHSASDIGIVYRAPIDRRHKTRLQICGLLLPCSWLFCKSQQYFESTYAQVHENRIEWNNPGLQINWFDGNDYCCSACSTPDKVKVFYMDNNITSYQVRPTICWPLFTHCSCCPTCCDLCGDGVLIYGNKPIPCWVLGFLTCNVTCCRTWDIVQGLVSGDDFIDICVQQKERLAENSKSTPPGPKPKDMLVPRGK